VAYLAKPDVLEEGRAHVTEKGPPKRTGPPNPALLFPEKGEDSHSYNIKKKKKKGEKRTISLHIAEKEKGGG